MELLGAADMVAYLERTQWNNIQGIFARRQLRCFTLREDLGLGHVMHCSRIFIMLMLQRPIEPDWGSVVFLLSPLVMFGGATHCCRYIIKSCTIFSFIIVQLQLQIIKWVGCIFFCHAEKGCSYLPSYYHRVTRRPWLGEVKYPLWWKTKHLEVVVRLGPYFLIDNLIFLEM